MSLFDQAKMIKEARRIQGELRNERIEIEKLEGKIKVVMNGEQKLEDLHIDSELLSPESELLLTNNLKQAISEAITKSQQVAAEKMKDIAGGLGLGM